jgi:hypothetical protein
MSVRLSDSLSPASEMFNYKWVDWQGPTYVYVCQLITNFWQKLLGLMCFVFIRVGHVKKFITKDGNCLWERYFKIWRKTTQPQLLSPLFHLKQNAITSFLLALDRVDSISTEWYPMVGLFSNHGTNCVPKHSWHQKTILSEISLHTLADCVASG